MKSSSRYHPDIHGIFETVSHPYCKRKREIMPLKFPGISTGSVHWCDLVEPILLWEKQLKGGSIPWWFPLKICRQARSANRISKGCKKLYSIYNLLSSLRFDSVVNIPGADDKKKVKFKKTKFLVIRDKHQVQWYTLNYLMNTKTAKCKRGNHDLNAMLHLPE